MLVARRESRVIVMMIEPGTSDRLEDLLSHRGVPECDTGRHVRVRRRRDGSPTKPGDDCGPRSALDEVPGRHRSDATQS